MSGFKVNPAGMAKLQRDLEAKFADSIRVPADGTDAEAVESVKDQLRALGAEPNDAAVEQMVRDARNR